MEGAVTVANLPSALSLLRVMLTVEEEVEAGEGEENEEEGSLLTEYGVVSGLGSGVLIGITMPAPLHSRMSIFCWWRRTRICSACS